MIDFITRAFTYPDGYDFKFELVFLLMLLIYLIDSLFVTKLWQYRDEDDDPTDEEMSVAARYYFFSLAAGCIGLFVCYQAAICAWIASFIFDMVIASTGDPPDLDTEEDPNGPS